MNQIRITRGPSARAEALEPRRLMAGPPSWGLAVHAMAFEDLDGNGRRTRNEPALPNVAIYNTTYGGESYAGATDDDGRWSYYSTGGAPADVRAVPPEGLHFSAGEDGTRSAFYPGRGGRTMVRRLRPIALTRTAGISGMLFSTETATASASPTPPACAAGASSSTSTDTTSGSGASRRPRLTPTATGTSAASAPARTAPSSSGAGGTN